MRRLLVGLLLAAALARAAYDPLRVGGDWLIDAYKRVISPLQGGNVCNFSPTCSQFTKAAIREQGFLPGVVMGADRLMRCSMFAWVYADDYYCGIEGNRLRDPVDRHVAWQASALAAAGPPIVAEPVLPAADSMASVTADPRLARDLSAAGAYAEAAAEYLRLRFAGPTPELRAYGGLMAGESYLAGSDFVAARKAFLTLRGTTQDCYARYGIARAWFAAGRLAATREALDSPQAGPDSLVASGLRRRSEVLAAWSWFKAGRFEAGAHLMAAVADSWPEQRQAAESLSQMDGRRLARRSRALSSLLSAVMPGSGQLYSGRAGDALYSFATVGALAGATAWFALNPERDPDRVKLGIFGALALLFHAGNIYGANIAARDFTDLARRRYAERADELFGTFDLVPDYTPLLDASGRPGLRP